MPHHKIKPECTLGTNETSFPCKQSDVTAVDSKSVAWNSGDHYCSDEKLLKILKWQGRNKFGMAAGHPHARLFTLTSFCLNNRQTGINKKHKATHYITYMLLI